MLELSSVSKLPPFTVAIGEGDYPKTEDLLDLIGSKVRKLVAFDAMEQALAAKKPLAVNMVLLGALFGATKLTISKAKVVDAIKRKTKKAFVEANLLAFDLGFKAAKAA